MTAGLVSRTALITGAGRGIGAAIATGLAKAGANVILLARTADQLNDNTYQATPVRAEAPDERVLRHKGLSLDFRTRTAAVQGPALDLTRSEFDLLHELLRGAQSARNPIWCVSSAGSTRTSIFVKPTNGGSSHWQPPPQAWGKTSRSTALGADRPRRRLPSDPGKKPECLNPRITLQRHARPAGSSLR